MQRVKQRKDFLAAARERAVATRGSVVQARVRGDNGPARNGFTVTKKLGNAVVRNRIRRRLKEAVRLGLVGCMQPGTDYVFIGRAATAARSFEGLIGDLKDAVKTLNAGGGRAQRRAGK